MATMREALYDYTLRLTAGAVKEPSYVEAARTGETVTEVRARRERLVTRLIHVATADPDPVETVRNEVYHATAAEYRRRSAGILAPMNACLRATMRATS